MILLYLFLFALAFLSFVRKAYQLFLLCLFGIITNLFMLDTSENLAVQVEDFVLGLFILLLPIVYIRDKNVFSWRQDKIAKWVYIFSIFYCLELAWTVISGAETFFNSIKVIRVSFMLWGYFVLKSIPVRDFTSFIKVMLIVTIIQAFLYLLQFFGINLLTGSEQIEEKSNDLGIYVASNIPTLTIFFLFFCMRAHYLGTRKFLLVSLFMIIIFLTFIRGMIISVLIALVYYIFKHGDKKKRIPLIAVLIFLFIAATFVVNKKSDASGGESASAQIVEIVSNAGEIYNIDKNGGTMTFRMAMLAERVMYLIENPQYLLLGVGTLHEDSPQTISRFNFLIGTFNEDRALGRTIIESGDITWVPIVLRYGLIGIYIHLMMLIVLFKETTIRKDVFVILSCLAIQMLLVSFNGSLFDRSSKLFFLAFFYAMVSRANLEKRQVIL